jgi:hypothetical protein
MGERKITGRRMREALQRLGFNWSHTSGTSHYVFQLWGGSDPTRPTTLFLPAVEDQNLEPAVVTYVRRQLDEAGIVSAEDFDDKL